MASFWVAEQFRKSAAVTHLCFKQSILANKVFQWASAIYPAIHEMEIGGAA